MSVLIPQPPSLLPQQYAPPIQISVVNLYPPLLAVSLKARGGPLPQPSAVHAYNPLLSALLPRRFDPPLQPFKVPVPLPQISALPIQPLSLNPPPSSYVLLQGRGGPLLLPSVAHAYSRLIPSLRLRQGVPPLMP